MDELVPEQVNVALRITETISHDPGRLSVDKGGPERLVAPLPFLPGVQEEFFVGHAIFYSM
jgi:hypothetical protein